MQWQHLQKGEDKVCPLPSEKKKLVMNNSLEKSQFGSYRRLSNYHHIYIIWLNNSLLSSSC